MLGQLLETRGLSVRDFSPKNGSFTDTTKQRGQTVRIHPIRVVKQGNYHVIVVTECSGVQHPMISMLFIP